MAIWEEVKDSVSEHPAYWAGGFAVLAIAVFLYYRSGSKSSTSGQPAYNFSYSVGPTAAQVAAGTAQQNQLQADQTAVSLANIAATANTSIAQTNANAAIAQSTDALNAIMSTNQANVAGQQTQFAISENANDDALQAALALG